MALSSGPKPADPVATAAAQTGTNVSTAVANNVMQNGTIITPDGTRSTTFDGSYSWKDPSTGQTYSIPRSTTTETLSAKNQAIKDQNDQSNLNLATYGNQQTEQLKQLGGTPFQYNSGDHEKWAGNLYDQLNADSNAQSEESLRTQLASRGIRMGSEAYNQEIANYSKGRNNARNQFMLSSQDQGFNQALTTRNQRYNEPISIATGTQIQNPNYNPARSSTIPTTDFAGIQANYDNMKMQRWQANQALLGGLFSSVGTAMAMSEPSMKKDKEKLPAKTKDGLQMWSYRYKGESAKAPKRVGVMADETERKMPQAVIRGADGKRRVNMGMVFGH